MVELVVFISIVNGDILYSTNSARRIKNLPRKEIADISSARNSSPIRQKKCQSIDMELTDFPIFKSRCLQNSTTVYDRIQDVPECKTPPVLKASFLEFFLYSHSNTRRTPVFGPPKWKENWVLYSITYGI